MSVGSVDPRMEPDMRLVWRKHRYAHVVVGWTDIGVARWMECCREDLKRWEEKLWLAAVMMQPKADDDSLEVASCPETNPRFRWVSRPGMARSK